MVGKNGRPLKYKISDLEAVRELNIKYGWGCLRISRKLGIPRSCVTNLLRKIPKTQSESEDNAITKILINRKNNHDIKMSLVAMPINERLDGLKTINDLIDTNLETLQHVILERVSSLTSVKHIIELEIERLQRFQLQDISKLPKLIITNP